MEPRLTPTELRQRMLRRLSTPDPGQTTEKVPWRRVVMDRAARAFVASLPCHELDVVEIGGSAWSDPGFGFRSYRSLSSPPWDLSREPVENESCSLAILEQGLERARRPRQALAKVLAMLRPGGSLLVSTSFLLKLDPRSPDLRRWTENGLRVLLKEAGFTAIATGSWGNRQCLAADLQPGVEGTSYDPTVHTLENEVECPLAVWAFAQKPAGRVVPNGRRHADLRTHGLGVVVLSRNGAGRIERCLESILESRFADEVVVCVDADTTDETAALARRYTPHVHLIETGGTLESALPAMAAHCSTDYLLRIDDDETLGGNWDRVPLEALVRANDLTYLLLPRRWLVAPGDRFIASEPWFPDYQVRFFRNDPALIRWPTTIHDPMEMKGRGMILFDRWIEHHDLALLSRAERERKVQRYRQIRPEKHLSNLYLYEEQNFDLLPADRAGFTEALETFLARRAPAPHQAVHPYSAGSEIRFAAGGNAAGYTREGWSDPEPWGCWTNGFHAALRIPLEQPFEGAAVLTVEAGAYVGSWHPTLNVRVVCNREPLGGWDIESPDPVERTLPIPASALAGKREILLVFHLDNPASPADSGEFGLDQRLLGLGFYKLRISAG
jgi:Glycosyl transferase family 2